MDRDSVQRWLDSYIEAWRSNEPAQVQALFTADAEYRFHPWDEPLVGAAAIAEAWMANPDDPSSWEATYEPLVVTDDVALATGHTDYRFENKVYDNLFVLRFADSGRCSSFTEWYMKRPAVSEA